MQGIIARTNTTPLSMTAKLEGKQLRKNAINWITDLKVPICSIKQTNTLKTEFFERTLEASERPF